MMLQRLRTWYRRWKIRRDAARKRRAWHRMSPEAQVALLIDYINRNERVRHQLRQALRVRGESVHRTEGGLIVRP